MYLDQNVEMLMSLTIIYLTMFQTTFEVMNFQFIFYRNAEIEIHVVMEQYANLKAVPSVVQSIAVQIAR